MTWNNNNHKQNITILYYIKIEKVQLNYKMHVMTYSLTHCIYTTWTDL